MNYNVAEDALWAMTFAQLCARRAGRDAATPVDLLCGVMLGGPETLGGHLLRSAGTHLDLFPSRDDPGWDSVPERPTSEGDFTADARSVLDGAFRLAEELGTPYVGSEHLLVSLLERSHGADLDRVVRESGLTESKVLRAWLAPYVGAA